MIYICLYVDMSRKKTVSNIYYKLQDNFSVVYKKKDNYSKKTNSTEKTCHIFCISTSKNHNRIIGGIRRLGFTSIITVFTIDIPK